MNTPNRNQRGGSQNNQDAQPPSQSTSTPPSPQNHDFVLMAILDMKRELGVISSQVANIAANQQRSDNRLEKIEESLNNISKKQYAAWIVLSIAIVIGGFIINKFWDTAASHIEVSIKQ